MSCEAKASTTRAARPEKIPSQAVALGLESGLVEAVAVRYESVHGKQATTREVISYAVDQHLLDLVGGLHQLGFRGGKIGKRRPRRIKQADWNALQAASNETGLPASTLLRACLTMTKHTSGGTNNAGVPQWDPNSASI